VLFLDEPTLGLDPVGARELRTLIAELARSGTTILLTTHYMFEADALCDRIAVIDRGTIVAQGTPAELKASVGARTIVEIETFGIPPERVESLRRIEGVATVGVEDRDQAQVVLVSADDGSQLTPALLAELRGLQIGRVSTREPTLEDAYVALVRQS